mmetsp:Transcript_18336/g.43555  ORF Transcript_18336/g.43555 Transcript_18336/m.43555 type:complete len:262 (+) Transcript_18336:12-797(+)
MIIFSHAHLRVCNQIFTPLTDDGLEVIKPRTNLYIGTASGPGARTPHGRAPSGQSKVAGRRHGEHGEGPTDDGERAQHVRTRREEDCAGHSKRCRFGDREGEHAAVARVRDSEAELLQRLKRAQQRTALGGRGLVGDEGDERRDADAADRGEQRRRDNLERRVRKGGAEQAERVYDGAILDRPLEAEARHEGGRCDRDHHADEHQQWRRLLRPPAEEVVDVVAKLRVDARVAQPDEEVGGGRAAQHTRAAEEQIQRAERVG